MTLDEAITRAKERARTLREYAKPFAEAKVGEATKKYIERCLERAEYNEQLAGWLEELAERREADRWIPVSEKKPEEKKDANTNDFAEVLCTTIFGGVRLYKYGTRIGDKQAHFWYGFGIFDSEITAWKYLPEPYKESEENK